MIFVLSIFVGFLAVIAWTIKFILNRKASIGLREEFQCPKGLLLCPGSVPEIILCIGLTRKCNYKQLKSNGFGGYIEFGNPSFFLTDLELIKRIYIKDFDHFVDRR
ncbi:unnamed protein product [Allacma fusca]|uniref:Cytochrome P450 n=1 Tax=Allacma fusca TaxID=39272 RepID=A0A8J2LTT1_9HEXA|nr:unnamed protein product [Allacma fusca]